MAQRNGLIEYFRFFAAVGIASYHFEWVYVGQADRLQHFYILVEFFFVLSGFFLAQNCIHKDESAMRYVWRQCCKLYPLYFFAFCCSFVVAHLSWQIGWKDVLEHLWSAKWEVLLCTIFAFDDAPVYNAGGAASYIPALLLASLILYYLLKEYRALFNNVLGPLMVVCGLSRIIHVNGNLSVWQQYDGFVTLGIVRACADMSIGILAAQYLLPVVQKRMGKGG